MDSVLLDVRYAVRALLNRPAFSALAVLTLAVGIGVNAVAFSAINALVFKSRSFDGAEDLVWITAHRPGNPYGHVSLREYREYAGARTFEAITAERRLSFSMRNGRYAEKAWALLVSTNYLPALRVRPVYGRLFGADDLAGTDVPAIVSYRFWNERLGGGTSTAGRTVTLNGRIVSIVGVLPDDFQGPGGLFEPDLWLPLDRIEAVNVPAPQRTEDTGALALAGRRRPGVTHAEAEAELRTIAGSLASAYPASQDTRLTVTPMTEGHPEVTSIAKFAWLALAAVGVVLLIACFNVAGLLLARASERQREIGVRAALGASRSRILRQLLCEGALLALVSGAASLVLAAWSADLLAAFSLPSPIPQRLHINLDRRLVLFTLAIVAIAAVLPALVPAFQAARVDLLTALRRDAGSGGRRARARGAFVIAQVAGSTLFLAAALLFVRSFWNSASLDTGFDTTRTVVLEINPANYGYDPPRTRALVDTLLERVSTVPGVASAAVADRVPFYVGFPRRIELSVSDTACESTDCRQAYIYAVSTTYFQSLGVPLRQGRSFTDAEQGSGTAIVLGEALANRLWPGSSAVGRWIRDRATGRQFQIVGVAADYKHHGLGENARSYVYRPLGDADFADSVSVVLRAERDPRPLAGALRELVHSLDPNLPASGVLMSERMALPLWPSRTLAGFFTICGTLAVLLATVGLFGVTSYAVSQRTREFGVRVAVGATPRNVLALVVGEGVVLTLAGAVIGIAAALGATRLIASALVGIAPHDPLTYAATAALQTLAAIAACAWPAYRATRADPLVALRQE
jgi:predicted permease